MGAGRTLAAAALLGLAPVRGIAARDPDLVAHWDLTAAHGPTVPDRAGDRHGRIHGAEMRPGGPWFDGKGDYVDCGLEPALKPSGDMTLCAWLHLDADPYPDSSSNWTIVDCERYRESGFILRVNADTGLVMYRVGRPGAAPHGTSDISLRNRRTCHVAVTKRDGVARIYVNGFPGPACQTGDPAPGPKPLTISHAVQSFSGRIYEVRLYRRALGNKEVKALFNQQKEDYDVETDPWYMPAPGAAAKAWTPMTKPRPGAVALSRPPASWVVTSSNGDFLRLYADRLIDDDPDTAWRSFQETAEEWIELKWDFPMQINRLGVFPHERNALNRVELLARKGEVWTPLGVKDTQPGQPVEFAFDPVTTSRLRMVLRGGAPGYGGVREVAAFGPAQPLLTIHSDGGRWQYVSALPREPAAGAPAGIALESFALEPSEPAPGDEVRLTLGLRPLAKLDGNDALVVTIGEREMNFHRSDYTVLREILRPDPPLAEWKPGESVIVEQTIVLPAHAPHGDSDVMLHGADSRCEVMGTPDGRIGKINIRRFSSDPVPDPTPHTVAVDDTDGTIITIDGQKTVPILFALQTPSFERYHHYSQTAGVKLYHLQIYPYRIDAGDYQDHHYRFVAGHVRNLLRIDPQAFVIIQMDMRTTAAWRDAHPGSSLVQHDGTEAHESFCAETYREEATSYVTNLVRFVDGQPWRHRVAGYLVELGEPEGVLSGADTGDYNPQAIEAFRAFLRARYGGSTDRLHDAYGDASLQFESLYPDHARIVAPGANGGCFLHPQRQRLAIDYHEFLSSLVPSLLTDRLAAAIKRLTDNRVLVGSYWAYMTHDLTFGAAGHQKNHCYLPRVLQSPHIDFFASPFTYWHPARHAGEPYRVFQTVDALRRNGKLHIPECDHRTFRAGVVDRGRNFSREDTLAIIRRDLGTALMHGMGAWFSDWTNNDSNDRRLAEPFFLDRQLLEEIAALREVYAGGIDRPRRETAEVAVVLSGPSHYYHDGNAAPLYYELIRMMLYRELNAMGAPYHELLFEDILKPEVQRDYRCFIFLNAFYMTDEQRRAVDGLKRDGNTLAWFYAPGYASDRDLSVANIERITGFQTGVEHTRRPLTYRTTDLAHPLLDGVPPGDYGGQGGDLAPCFHITDPSPEVAVLGRFVDGKAALAARRFDDYTTVYCAASFMNARMLHNLLRYAGCHVWVEEEIYMDATHNVLMLTNTFDRERTLDVRLPRRCDVLTLPARVPVARDSTRFEAHLPRGHTALYHLE